MARELDISLGTAKAHTEAMYQRLGAHNRNEAVYIAHQKGARLLNETGPQEGQAYA
ncbi:MAG: response regulator transcription factor [Alcaligenaceae bacterium]|nr:response regulator transcription factor [Alcaligenaceae bacterium]